MPRRIQSMGNLCLGGKTGGKTTGRKKFGGKMGPSPLSAVHDIDLENS